MSVRQAFVGIVLLGFAAAIPAKAVPTIVFGHSGDSWESDPAADHSQVCSQLDEAFISAVPPAKRASAITKLSNEAIIAIDDREAGYLLQVEPGEEGLAATRVSAAIDGMEAKKQLERDHQTGAWSDKDEITLNQLKEILAGRRIKRFRPILVRSLGDNDLPWHAIVEQCDGDAIRIIGTTQSANLAPRRVPLILFLEQSPKTLFVFWGAINPDSAP